MITHLKRILGRSISIGWIIYISGLYIIKNFVLTGRIESGIKYYIFQTLIWTIPAVLINKWGPGIYLKSKIRYRVKVYQWAFYSAVSYMGCQFFIGFIQGFGRSPYSHTPIGVISNFCMVASVLVGRELMRSYIIHSFEREKRWLILVSLLMTVISLRVSTIANSLGNERDLLITVAQVVLPELGNNVVATCLALYGGAMAAIIYLGTLEGIKYLSPILPNLNWLAIGVISMMIPVILVDYISRAYKRMNKEMKERHMKEKNILIDYIVIALAVIIIWFGMGVFSVYSSVIVTGSMQPEISPGDVVIIQRLTTKEEFKKLQTGDIIEYERDGVFIVHRIVEIIEENGQLSYKMKGDNNFEMDRGLIKQTEVKGKVKSVIPEIGWLILWVKQI